MPQTSSSDANFTILAGDEQIATLRLNRFYRDWQQALAGGMLPGTDFADLAAFDYLAGARLIFDVEAGDGGRHYRYRHIDAPLLAYGMRDMTGLCVHEHAESYFAAQTQRAFDLVVGARRPIHAQVRRAVEGRPFGMEFLILPLGDDGENVTMLFVAQLFAPL